MSSSTTNYSAPQVLHLEDRGDCAIEYIDLFDEGRYGADKLFFRGRFSTLEEVAYQISILLKMGSPLARTFDATSTTEIATGVSLPNMLCMNRWTSDTYRDVIATKDLRDCWHNKAHFPINILLRIKFYSDFAYVHIGDKWGTLFDEITGEVKKSDSQYLPTLNGKELIDTYSLSTEEDFSIICHSNISLNDSKLILAGLFNIALDDKVKNEDTSDLSYAVTPNGLAYGTLSSMNDIINIDNSTIKDISNVIVDKNYKQLWNTWEYSSVSDVELSIPYVEQSSTLFGHSSISSISLDAPSLTTASYTFTECKALTDAYLSISSITNAEQMFNNCESLVNVSFRGELSSLTNAENMFNGCISLTDTSIMNILNALPDHSGNETLSLIGFKGVLLADAQIKAFAAKGWYTVDAENCEYSGDADDIIIVYNGTQLYYGYENIDTIDERYYLVSPN